MQQSKRKVMAALVLLGGMAVAAVALARMPQPGRESGNWDYVDSAGQVVGGGMMDCSGQITTFGLTTARMANIEIERCR